MTAGHIGNRHSRLPRFLHKGHLLLCGIPTAALDTGKHCDSISIRRHSRITKRTPSSYLGDCVRFKWGLLHSATSVPHAAARRTAISGVTGARALTMAEMCLRLTPKASAASVMLTLSKQLGEAVDWQSSRSRATLTQQI